MSRLGKKPIEVPNKTSVSIDGREVTVEGPEGKLERRFPADVELEQADDAITITPANSSKRAQTLWGTYASHLQNMIQGVNQPYEKKLEFKGVGYRANVSGSTLVLEMGYSHDVELDIPDGLDVSVEKKTITVKGISKEAVGQFAANVRNVRRPEPYKGKGIKYSDEVIRRKEGKKAV